MREQIQQANDATYEAWCAHDADAVGAVFAADAVAYDVGNPEPLRGRQAIRDRAAEVMAAFPDFRLERLVLLIDGDMNADRWRAPVRTAARRSWASSPAGARSTSRTSTTGTCRPS